MIPLLLENILKQDKTILVYGLGKSGSAAVDYLLAYTHKIIGVDKNANLRDDIEIYSEENPPLVDDVGLAIISPGISSNAPLIKILIEKKIPIVGEFDLGIMSSDLPQIVITGSNGKSTTTALVGKIIKNSIVCGNIGIPIISVTSQSQGGKALVIEASSYQLENVTQIKPKIAAILNISENHLERHGTIDNYIKAKLNLIQNQDSSDYCVLNSDDGFLIKHASAVNGILCLFGQSEEVYKAKYYAKIEYDPSKRIDRIHLLVNGIKVVYELGATRLIGLHNRYNWAAAILIAKLFGCEDRDIQEEILNFEGLPHRLEVTNLKPYICINDSKSTTVGSTLSALNSVSRAYPHTKIHLLLGGKMKIGSWASVISLLKELEDFVMVYCFGGDGEKIAAILAGDGIVTKYYARLKDAIFEVKGFCKSDEIILLSPGCASFDEFSNFEDRGDFFRSSVS